MALERDNPFDDSSWFSKSREFGCVNIVATQSLSSLYACGRREAVDALFSNCSAKIVLQNDDPAADAFFRHFCGVEKTLAQLGPGEALVSRYDVQERRQMVAHLHFDKAFQRTRSALFASPAVVPNAKPNRTVMDQMRVIDAIFETAALKRQGRVKYALYRRHADILVAPDVIYIDAPARWFVLVSGKLDDFRKAFDGRVKIQDIVDYEGRLFLGVNAKDAPPDLLKAAHNFAREVLYGTASSI